MPTANFYTVENSAGSFMFIGTSKPDGEHVWLCSPTGERAFRVPAKFVRQVSKGQLAARLVAERRAQLSARN